jgi:hypothetical protein
MMTNKRIAFVTSTLIALAGSAATNTHAQISAADLAQLGTSPTSKFTPMGAERAGNAAGTIPAWDGGITKVPDGIKHEKGNHYADPFPNDKVLFTISAENVDKYKENLSAGQIALLKMYPTHKMNVYQTRRTGAYPQKHYEQTRACAQKATLAEGGNGVIGCTGGIPFPIPQNGLQAIWNHHVRYWGDAIEMHFVHIAPTKSGEYTPSVFEYQAEFHYGNLALPANEIIPNRRANYLQTVTGPPRLAGEILLKTWIKQKMRAPRGSTTQDNAACVSLPPLLTIARSSVAMVNARWTINSCITARRIATIGSYSARKKFMCRTTAIASPIPRSSIPTSPSRDI